MNALEAYNPYNFSTTRCYVIVFDLDGDDYIKIEHKLPNYIKKLRGVFISTTYRSAQIKHVGIISLNFNGQAFKSFQLPVPETAHQYATAQPLELNETILPNSFLQGYFYGIASAAGRPYRISIYLHYDYERS
jgi:hypothetical protein